MDFCRNKAPLDFGEPCVRALWETLLPSVLVVTLCLFSTPISLPISKAFHPLTRRLKPFLTLQEAEALSTCGSLPEEDHYPTPQPESRRISRWVFTLVGAAQALCWLLYGVYLFVDNVTYWWRGTRAFAFAAAWLYTAIAAERHRRPTPPYDVFAIYLTLLVAGGVGLGGVLYDYSISTLPPPDGFSLGMISVHLVATMVVLMLVLRRPVAVPGIWVAKEDIGHRVSPEDYTTLWGWITFSWVYPLVRKGRHTVLEEDDVWDLSPTLRSRPLFFKFSEVKISDLFRRVLAANSRDMILDVSLTLVSVLFKYGVIVFLRRVLDEIDRESSSRTSKSKAYVDAFLMFACTVMKAQAEVQHLWFARHAATRVRTELITVIYDKALRRKDYSAIVDEENEGGKAKHQHKAGADAGKIANLMSTDASRISDTIADAHIFFSAPLEAVIAGILLYQLLGNSAFVGLVILATCWPLSKFFLMRARKVHKEVAIAKDHRMSVLTELVGAIKFIKLFAQEYEWTGNILEAREKELTLLAKARSKSIRFYLVWSCAPTLVSIASLSVYVSHGNILSISTIFTAIALFNMVQQPFNTFPGTVGRFLSSGRAFKRISDFLDEEEVSEQVSSLKSDSPTSPPTNPKDALGFKGASFKWNIIPPDHKPTNGVTNGAQHLGGFRNGLVVSVDASLISSLLTDAPFQLRDLNVEFPEGKLTVVTGPTASGKTALLMALLGEMTILSGEILLHKDPTQVRDGLIQTVSYAAQNPWLRKKSIRRNILFGLPYEEERYYAVLEACALKQDLALLEEGDDTRALSLSGGQKSRVALARAVYARTKYVLLDDVFSCVDGRTARFLYENLLCGPLLTGRTVVLVTSNTELVLPAAYYLIEMRDGRISSQGTVKEQIAQGVLGQKSFARTLGKRKRPQRHHVESQISDIMHKPPRPRPPRAQSRGIKWSVYKEYLTASSWWPWVILGISLIVQELLGVSEKLWTKTWGEAYGPLRGSWPDAASHPYFYVGTYAAIGLAAALTNVLAVTVQYNGALETSRVFFRKLLVTVVGASYQSHDTIPPGQVLNRFGRDMEIIDDSLAGSLRAVSSSLFGFFAAILTVVVIFPGFLIPGFFLGLAYRRLAIRYLNTGRDLRRMEAASKSPIFSEFQEVLDGIVTIRAFSVERDVLENMHKRVDDTTKMWYSFWMANRWLLLNVDCLGALGVLITTFLAIPTPKEGAAWAAVSITSSMAFTMSIYWACRFWTDLELDICSVERVVEFLDLQQEAKTISGHNRVPAAWPTNPDVIIENLTVRYGPGLPHALSEVSLHLKCGERIGLLGRTGSGKSTLVMSLLRLVDPSYGRIIIDGIDISSVGLHDLRSRITFIPQDAPLFRGTLRTNLDPFDEHSDEECRDVLERVQLMGSASEDSVAPSPTYSTAGETASGYFSPGAPQEIVGRNTKITLATRVAAGGTNFSEGQRQMISIARALLKRSSIVILDEGTHSIDPATAMKIRQTIREEFVGSLLITVAHRLNTIIDYDRLIVLSEGRVVEFDTPWNLMQKDGIFRDFCIESGSFARLEAIAKSKAEGLV